MLLKLRGGQGSFFATILLGVLIASFAIWGIGPTVFSSASQTVAQVGETEVHAQSYYRRVQNRAQTLQAQFGGSMSSQEIINLMRLDQQVLSQMIGEAAITEHLRLLGMRAGNTEVRKELESYEGFVLPDGTLSKDMVLQALRNTGMTRAEFMNDVRGTISRRNLLQTLIGNEAPLGKGFAEELYRYQAERRRATMINFPADSVEGVIAPTEEELQTYYEDNKTAYYTDERRTYNYILVTPEQFEDAVQLPEGIVEQEYESRIDEFVTPELRGLQQVGFNDKASADAFLTAVTSGADFIEAATAVTAFSAEEIELGDFSKADVENDYSAEIAELIFAQNEGGVTPPVESFGGWNVFKVVSITKAAETTLEDVRAEIEGDLKAEAAIDLMYEKVDLISDAMAEESQVAAIAEKAGLPMATVTAVNNQGLSPDGTPAVTQQNESIILRAAFQQEIGIEADIVDLDPRDSSKGLYMVELTEVTDPAERPFEEVKADVEAALLSIKRSERAAEIAEQAKARMEAGEVAEDVAADLGGTSFIAKNVARSADENTSLAPNIRRLIFDLEPNSIDFEQAADANGYILVRVDEVTPGDPSARPADVLALQSRLNNQVLDELYIQYLSHLRNQYQPTTNPALLQSLFTDNNQ